MSEYKFSTTVVYPFRPVAVSIGRRNREYWELTDAQLSEKHADEDKRIFAYSFPPVPCDLVPEPDNPEDPNAIMILLDGKHVGYVPASLCPIVRPLLNLSPTIRGRLESGPRKTVMSGDVRHFDDPFLIHVTLTYDGTRSNVTRSVSSGRGGGKVNVPVKTVLQWIVAVLLLIFGLSMLPSFSSVLFVLAGVLAAPVRKLRELLARYRIRPWMIAAAAVILTVLAFVVAPSKGA